MAVRALGLPGKGTLELILKDKYILLWERYVENAVKTHPVISSG